MNDGIGTYASLVEAYESESLDIASGLNPTLYRDFFAAPFTWLVRDGACVTDGLGISPVEIYFLECLGRAKPAKKIFVIGNAYGWSTLALALANPGARVVAIDAGFDENTIEGLEVTNRIASRFGLDVRASKAVSPQGVAAVVEEELGEIDLAFIDGFHSPTQLYLDWSAVRPFLKEDGIAVFHDVLFCELRDGFEKVRQESGWGAHILHSTTTGIGVLFKDSNERLERVVRAFSGNRSARAVIEKEANALAHLRGPEQRAEALKSISEIELRMSRWRLREGCERANADN